MVLTDQTDCKPVVCDGMLRDLMTVVHQRLGCMGHNNLCEQFKKAFYLGHRFSVEKLQDIARSVQCDVCKSHLAKPKKHHCESIYTHRPFERMQMDTTEMAPTRVSHLRSPVAPDRH